MLARVTSELERRVVPVRDMNDVIGLIATSSEAWLAEGAHIQPDCALLARELSHAKRRHVGLFPVGEDVPIAEVARELGQALALLLERPVLLLDPERRSLEGEPSSATAEREATPRAPGVVALAPTRTAAPGAKFEALLALTRFVDTDAEPWGAALIDLGGCTLPGELLGVLHVLDAVVVIGRLGRTTEAELRRAARSLPPETTLGVLLVA
jgi:hypothetical protein